MWCNSASQKRLESPITKEKADVARTNIRTGSVSPSKLLRRSEAHEGPAIGGGGGQAEGNPDKTSAFTAKVAAESQHEDEAPHARGIMASATGARAPAASA